MTEVIENGPSGPHGRPPRGLLMVAAAAALGLAAFAIHAVPTESPTEHRSASPTATAAPSTGRPARPIPVTTRVGHPLLPGAPVGWQLFARTGHGMDGPAEVLRLQLARGLITRTRIPKLQSTGSVSFVAGHHRVLVRPLDNVPGYAVPDGEPARKLTGRLGHGGPVLPGPKPNQVWVSSGHDEHRMLLIDLDGHATGASVRVSTGDRTVVGAADDGAGYILFPTVGGVVDIRPSVRRRITTGDLLAVGPTAWLTRECPPARRCTVHVVNPDTGARRTLHTRALTRPRLDLSGYGAISPDGATAALADTGTTGSATPRLHLIDLHAGTDRRPEATDTPVPGSSLIWSPDSRWLFAVHDLAGPVAIDRETLQVHGLTQNPLLGVTQLAFRYDGGRVR